MSQSSSAQSGVSGGGGMSFGPQIVVPSGTPPSNSEWVIIGAVVITAIFVVGHLIRGGK